MAYPQFKLDGNFYVADVCVRCYEIFYTHAMVNCGMLPAYRLCPSCRGVCSAAEQDHFNARIENLNLVPEDAQ